MGFHITSDNQDGQYIVRTKDGEVKFNKDEMVIPCIDANKPQNLYFVQTVHENLEGFTKKDIAAAKLTRESQGVGVYPSDREFKSTVINNIIQN